MSKCRWNLCGRSRVRWVQAGGIRVANFRRVSAQILETAANPEADFPNIPKHPNEPVTPEESNIYRTEIRREASKVSLSAPVREHQHFIQRQQYYTGDA